MTDTNRASIDEISAPNAVAPRVVIVGGGFGGLAAYAWDGEVYCDRCLPAQGGKEAEAVLAISEWDYAPVRCVCGVVHDYVNVLNPTI